MENALQSYHSWRNEEARPKKKGAYFILEIAFFLVFCVIIAAAALGMLGNTDSSKVATTTQELDQIRTAVMSYKTYRIDGAAPDSLGVLCSNTAISATDAVDGRQHGPFLSTNPRWSESNLLDLWGNSYVLEDNKIYSTAGSSDSANYISTTLGSDN